CASWLPPILPFHYFERTMGLYCYASALIHIKNSQIAVRRGRTALLGALPPVESARELERAIRFLGEPMGCPPGAIGRPALDRWALPGRGHSYRAPLGRNRHSRPTRLIRRGM